ECVFGDGVDDVVENIEVLVAALPGQYLSKQASHHDECYDRRRERQDDEASSWAHKTLVVKPFRVERGLPTASSTIVRDRRPARRCEPRNTSRSSLRAKCRRCRSAAPVR